MIRNCWYAAGFSGEFPAGRVEGRTVTGRPMVMWRSRARGVTALDARCVHKCFPLWDGRLVEGDVLECAYHGFAYDADGRCVAIPALHDRSGHIPATAVLRKFPVTEQDGVVWVWPGDPALSQAAGPPCTPEIGLETWDTVNTGPMLVRADARLLIENLLDLTHFYPLHAGNLGTYADARVPVTIERATGGQDWLLRTVRRREDFGFGPLKRDWFGVERGDNLAVHDFVSPGLFRVSEKGAPPGGLGTARERGFMLYQTITPVDESSHVWRRSVSCPAGERLASEPFAAAVTESLRKTIEEDRWALERQQEMLAHADESYREVHIRTDGAVVIARHLLDEMERAERDGPGRDAPPASPGPRGPGRG